MAFAEFFLAEEEYNRKNTDVESSQNENCGFDWRGGQGEVETDEGLVNSGTGIMTEDELFFVLIIRELLLRVGNGACRRSAEKGSAG